MNKETSEVLARIFNKLWVAKSNGLDCGIKIFKEEIMTVLEEQHAVESPEVLDDDMPDHFDVWVMDLVEEMPLLGTIIN